MNKKEKKDFINWLLSRHETPEEIYGREELGMRPVEREHDE